MHIRDFIYLDIERVRSFYSQLSEGLPTEQTIGAEHGFDTSASLEGNILFAKGRGTTDARYMKANTETRSLHDYLMKLFIDKLQEEDLLLRIDENFDWKEEAFIDGCFILTKGRIKIINNEYIKTQIIKLPKMLTLMNKIINKTNLSQSKTTSKSEPSELEILEKQIKSLPTEDISQFIEHYIPENLRIKIYPYYGNNYKNFVASANEGLFRQSAISIINTYGHIIDTNWYSLLQINRGIYHPLSSTATKENDLETAIEALLDNFINISNAIQGIRFPSISATPIAIFREI